MIQINNLRRLTMLLPMLAAILLLISAAACAGADTYDTGMNLRADEFNETGARNMFASAVTAICQENKIGISVELASALKSVETASAKLTSSTWTFTAQGETVRVQSDGIVEGELLKDLTSRC